MKNKNKEQQKAKRKLRRNFFNEAVMRELAQEHSRQLSESIKRGIRAKSLSTRKN